MFHRLRSKLANILMTRELESRESGQLRFHSVDPGFTWTDIHTSQLPFLHSWIVWVAGPLLGARCRIHHGAKFQPRIPLTHIILNSVRSQSFFLLIYTSLQVISASSSNASLACPGSSTSCSLLAPTGALIVMMVYYIYIYPQHPLFQIFTQSQQLMLQVSL